MGALCRAGGGGPGGASRASPEATAQPPLTAPRPRPALFPCADGWILIPSGKRLSPFGPCSGMFAGSERVDAKISSLQRLNTWQHTGFILLIPVNPCPRLACHRRDCAPGRSAGSWSRRRGRLGGVRSGRTGPKTSGSLGRPSSFVSGRRRLPTRPSLPYGDQDLRYCDCFQTGGLTGSLRPASPVPLLERPRKDPVQQPDQHLDQQPEQEFNELPHCHLLLKG